MPPAIHQSLRIIAALVGSVWVFSAAQAADPDVMKWVRSVTVPLSVPAAPPRPAQVVCTAVMLQPGRAITAYHCIDQDRLTITINGTAYPVAQSYSNPSRDLAILVVPNAPCPCADLRAQPAQIDEEVMLVGWPYGRLQTLVHGHVQGRDVDQATGREQVVSSLDGAPGKSGGGVFDSAGRLLAITTQMAEDGFLTYSEELPLVTAFLEDPK